MLEVCVEDAHGLAAAARGGANRVELCAALDVGGLTPPLSLIRAAAAGPLPVHLLCRPRAGGFAYTPAEQAMIADDIRTAAEAGLAGVAIGACDDARRLDAPLLAGWIAHARLLAERRGAPLSLTLHRAFDLAPDLDAALDAAIDLGFDRVLTSGGAPRAVDGALARLVSHADGRIIILAASGITADNAPAVLATGVRELHASCRDSRSVPGDMPERRFGFAGARVAATDPDRVAALVATIRQSG